MANSVLLKFTLLYFHVIQLRGITAGGTIKKGKENISSSLGTSTKGTVHLPIRDGPWRPVS